MPSDWEKLVIRKPLGFMFFLACLSVFFSACAEIQRPQPEPFYAETTPPAKQEFRWSNGKTAKSFDPARAAAAPETDIVHALFEGLTDIDPRTLKEVPGAAEGWSSSPDFRVWTFQLRKDARWSNGQHVTADDFVTSWKRLATLGDKAAHPELFQNIVGLQTLRTESIPSTVSVERKPVIGEKPQHNEQRGPISSDISPDVFRQPAADPIVKSGSENRLVAKPVPKEFGVAAVDETTLRVTLEVPDKDFPKLVANSIFLPIYGDGVEFDTDPLDADIVTNGPFIVAGVGKDSILLDRSDTFWGKGTVSLEQVRFVFKDSAEAALTAYKKGEIDALTNAEFEPLALKILSPYDDFRQTTHSALNMYQFNMKNAPFSDQRIREALAISVDRERLTQVELEGTARPAMSFLPLGGNKNSALTLDVQKAKQLLETAGFAGGVGFPKIRLLINRNDTQQRIARAVARMWKQNLNLDTEIIVKEWSEVDAARSAGDYDLVRRGVVLPTVDESAAMTAIFGQSTESELQPRVPGTANDKVAKLPASVVDENESRETSGSSDIRSDGAAQIGSVGKNSEEDALRELNAIPLYFPMAYSLVKPYVRGFDVNGLDAAALENISIDSSWQPNRGKTGS